MNKHVNFNVKTIHGDFEDVARQHIAKSSAEVLIVTNPPYGTRLSKDEAKVLSNYFNVTHYLTN